MRREDECSLFKSIGDDWFHRVLIACEIWSENYCSSYYENTDGMSCFYKCQWTVEGTNRACKPFYLGYRNEKCGN